MTNFSARLSVDYSTGRVLAVSIRICFGRSESTTEALPGRLLLDRDDKGRLLSVEMLAPCTDDELVGCLVGEPEDVRAFILGVMPRAFVKATAT